MDQSTSNHTKQTSPSSSDPVTTTTTGKTKSFFRTLDDKHIMKQVLDTHHPKWMIDIDFTPLVNIVEEILWGATTKHENSISLLAYPDAVKLVAKSRETNMGLLLNEFSQAIHKLAFEMSFKSFSGKEGHAIAVSLFSKVGEFEWHAKMPLILAGFALNYGEFELLAQICSSNQLAKSIPLVDTLNKLIHSIIKLTWCIIEFKMLSSLIDIKPDEVPAMVNASNAFPTAAYWSARGIITCAAQISRLTIYMGHEYEILTDNLLLEAFTSAFRISQVLEFLMKQLDECRRLIGYQGFNRLLNKGHIDNMTILKILLNQKDDPLPLFDGAAKQRVSLEVLRKRNVLWLISGLHISLYELSIVEEIYSESRIQGSRLDSLYDVLWVPIVDSYIEYTDAMHRRFVYLKTTMPWYSVDHPSYIDREVKWAIERRWLFRNKPAVVVLDPRGRELSPNALHMMCIWGSTAFPFTIAREEALWRDETWRLELLVSDMDPTILNWIRDDKYIFLFGGDDIEWIRKFTRTARAMANAAGIPLEMAYVGKSKKRENVYRATATINVEKLSYCWQESTLWSFWSRLESMLSSKLQLRHSDDKDLIMPQLKKLLRYDMEGSWALLCRGSQILTLGNGSTMLQTPADFDLWEAHIPSRGFDLSFKDYHDKFNVAANKCCRFEFPIAAGRIPEGMRCPECHRLMEKYMAFLCCHDQTGLLEPY